MYQQVGQPREESHTAVSGAGRSVSRSVRSVNALQSVLENIKARQGRARQFWRVFETSRVPMTMADARRRHLAANSAARLLFRLSLAEVLERRIDDLTPPERLPLLYNRWARLMSNGAVAGVYDISLPDGNDVSVVYSAVANALPGQHLIVFAPADWLEDELVDLEAAATAPPTRTLSNREREVLWLIGVGADRQQIADELTISVATVRTHVRNILRKLGARNRAHAIAVAMQQGLLDVPGDSGDPGDRVK